MGRQLPPGGTPTRLTSIHATLGPASADLDTIRAMAAAGMDACRLNMSHGSPRLARQIIRNVRAVSAEMDRPIPIGADLRGPKLRIGEVAGGSALLESGVIVRVTARPGPSDAASISVDYPYLAEDVRPDDWIMIQDGFIALRAESVSGGEVVARVRRGGMLLPRKGVNLPGIPLRVPSVTPKDLEDIAFAVGEGVDFLFVSYARSRRHIQEVRDAVGRAGGLLPIVAKIERRDGVAALAEICDEAEGICIARGDLGVEVALSDLPGIQRDAASLCHAAGKFVMNGGQMLTSMVSSPLPLRAEVSDLSVAVRDGLDAIVLSDETAAGEYPVDAVRVAAEVLAAAEEHERRCGTLLRTLRLVAPARRLDR